MPDPERIAQAQALEIPVTIQGSKIVDGTDRRELFSEQAKTTLVFRNGTVLNLRSRIAPGQSIFLRNDQSGHEILCRVLEAPAEGQSGFTDLEFTAPNLEFWGAAFQHAAADAAQPAEPAPAETEKPMGVGEPAPAPTESSENTLAMMSSTSESVTLPSAPAPPQEELVSAHETIPEAEHASAIVPALDESSVPTGEEIDAALKKLAAGPAGAPSLKPAGQSPAPADVPHANEAQDQENLAALMAQDAKRAKRAAAEKAKEAKKAAFQGTAEGAVDAEVGTEGQEVIVVPKKTLEQILTTGKGAVVVGVVTSVVIVAALVAIWQAVRYPFAYQIDPPSVSLPKQPKKSLLNTILKPGQKASAPVAGMAAKPGMVVGPIQPASMTSPAKPAPSAAKPPIAQTNLGQPPSALRPPAGVGKAPAPVNPVAASSAKDVKTVAPAATPVAPAAEPERVIASNAATAPAKHSKAIEKPAPEITPAKIVSQTQPSFPLWAKSLDVDNVVTLDAVIDEKGNLVDAKLVSGPRVLEHAAEQAAGLWIFEPALADGKPTASHLVLTVEFEREPVKP